MNYKIIESNDKIKFCVILLHGLGSNGSDLINIVNHFNINLRNIRFIFPNASIIPISVYMGAKMNAWYDIKSFDVSSLNKLVDINGIINSIEKLNKLIDIQIKQGIPSEKIILLGFSQGGVIAIYTAITSQKKIAGVIGLSTYLPGLQFFKNKITNVNKNMSILICHGTNDKILPEILGYDLSNKLKLYGFHNKYKSYIGMQHLISTEEIKDISCFIANIFKI